MKFQHRRLSAGAWNQLTLCEQLANAGSEVIRSIDWRPRNVSYSRLAAERALELLSLTIDDPKNRPRLVELTRLYEIVVDQLYGFEAYGGGTTQLTNYFLAFNLAANS